MLLKTLMIVASSVSLAAAELGRDKACYETSKTLTKFAYSTWNGFRPDSMPLPYVEAPAENYVICANRCHDEPDKCVGFRFHQAEKTCGLYNLWFHSVYKEGGDSVLGIKGNCYETQTGGITQTDMDNPIGYDLDSTACCNIYYDT